MYFSRNYRFMLQNWMKPVQLEEVTDYDVLNKGQLGQNILIHHSDFPLLNDISCAIIGVSPFANRVRTQLYRMQWAFGDLNIADIGDVANTTSEFIKPLLQELIHSGITPILIGGDKSHIQNQVLSLTSNFKHIHPLFVDERICYGKVLERSYLNNIIELGGNDIQALSILGYQRHLSGPQALAQGFPGSIHTLRLGQLRQNKSFSEPLIRAVDSISFSLNAMKKADAPLKSGHNPSGLNSEEACQICRYCGLNEKLRSFGIFDLHLDDELDCNQTAILVSQLLWYFLDGVSNRLGEFPMTPEHLTQYLVSSAEFEQPLNFYKSKLSGRWWMENPDNPNDYNTLIPCTYEEYLASCRNEIPDRILDLFI